MMGFLMKNLYRTLFDPKVQFIKIFVKQLRTSRIGGS